MNTDPWRPLLAELSETSSVAEWRLTSGITFFMAVPAVSRLTERSIDGSTVAYGEIEQLIFRSQQHLGSLEKQNDLDALASRAMRHPRITVVRSPDKLVLSRAILSE